MAVNGVSPGLFATTVQLAANAGPILRVIMAAGKFHGVIQPQTPTGSLTAETRLPGTDTCRRTTGGFLAEPFNEGRSVLDFALGLNKRFSILPGYQSRQVVHILQDEVIPTP